MSEVSRGFTLNEPDSAGLHAAVERLRRLLQTYTAPAAGVALGGFDRSQVLASLQLVLNEVETGSTSEWGLTASGPTPWLSGRVPDLAGAIGDLHAALAQRLERILGPGKIAVVRRLLLHPAPDLLGLLSKTHDENMHSAMLGWLLDPRQAPGIAVPALSRLANWLPEPDAWRRSFQSAVANDSLCVRMEYTIAREWTDEERLDRIDIVVSGPKCILAIENKIRAREHDAQTESYWAWLEPLGLLRGGLFLSPSGLPPMSPGFHAISYLELLSCLLDGAVTSTLAPGEETMLASYLKTLSNGPLQPELRCIR
jgi:PD-(D/E)XK nuclease superfamily